MAQQTGLIARVLARAEEKFGFRFACEMHQALSTGAPGGRAMLRKVLAS